MTFNVLTLLCSGGRAAHGGHGNGCVSLLYCLVKNSAKYCYLFLPLLSFGQLHLRSDFGYYCFTHFVVASDGTGQVNQAGIDHYNKVINALLSKGEWSGDKSLNTESKQMVRTAYV